jgi:hypothetical protein
MINDEELEKRLSAVREMASLEEPPSDTVARASHLFRFHYPAPEGVMARIARLTLDSFRGPNLQMAPARGASLADMSESRELLFEVDDLTLRFFQEPDENFLRSTPTWYLIGQVMGADTAPLTDIKVRLESGDSVLESQEMGRGELHIEGVLAGSYQAQIVLPSGETICIPELQIGVV